MGFMQHTSFEKAVTDRVFSLAIFAVKMTSERGKRWHTGAQQAQKSLEDRKIGCGEEITGGGGVMVLQSGEAGDKRTDVHGVADNTLWWGRGVSVGSRIITVSGKSPTPNCTSRSKNTLKA